MTAFEFFIAFALGAIASGVLSFAAFGVLCLIALRAKPKHYTE